MKKSLTHSNVRSVRVAVYVHVLVSVHSLCPCLASELVIYTLPICAHMMYAEIYRAPHTLLAYSLYPNPDQQETQPTFLKGVICRDFTVLFDVHAVASKLP